MKILWPPVDVQMYNRTQDETNKSFGWLYFIIKQQLFIGWRQNEIFQFINHGQSLLNGSVFLQSLTHDMLQTIMELRSPPTLSRVNLSEVFVLRDLSVALSSCIYQSLCDSDSVKQAVDAWVLNSVKCLCAAVFVAVSCSMCIGWSI